MDKNPGMISAILTVKHAQNLSPHYIRITLTGDDVPLFKHTTIGVNNKIFLPATGDGEIHFDSKKSIRRTYTHRGINVDRKEMIIDFVAHGESGPASAWAIHAKSGDKLGVVMKNATMQLYPKADWYLLVGDATGIPVLAAILESLPASAKGIAFIEVLNKEEEIPLWTAADIQINWVHNSSPGKNSPLVTTVRNALLPDRKHMTSFGYVAAEFATVKGIRSYLRKEQGWDKKDLYAYSYWKYGQSEDHSVKERQEEKQSLS